jgi:hypothetical protein
VGEMRMHMKFCLADLKKKEDKTLGNLGENGRIKLK